MLAKILSLGLTSLLGIGLAAAFPPPPPEDGPPPRGEGKEKAKDKEKDGPGPQDGLRKAYDMLRRVRSDGRATGRPEERLRDWTDRAVAIYRDGVKAHKAGDDRAAQEYGHAAHDLARAVDHARNAAALDRSEPDPELPPPPPPTGPGPGDEDDAERATHDLRRAYDHIRDQLDKHDQGKDAKFYNDASRDLYNAARRDAEAGRSERAIELARAAEDLSHVNEHLAHASGARPEPPKGERPEAKTKPEPKEKGKEKGKEKAKDKAKVKKGEPGEKKERPEPKGDRPGDGLPPPLDE